MKYLKKYEMIITDINMNKHTNMLKKYKFKIGDYIKLKVKNSNIYKIISINTNNLNLRYEIQNINTGIKYASDCDNFELVPDYEVNANKYNI